jgi:hypothetical protein
MRRGDALCGGCRPRAVRCCSPRSECGQVAAADRWCPRERLAELPVLTYGRARIRHGLGSPSLTCADSAQWLSSFVTPRRRLTAWRRHDLEEGCKREPQFGGCVHCAVRGLDQCSGPGPSTTSASACGWSRSASKNQGFSGRSSGYSWIIRATCVFVLANARYLTEKCPARPCFCSVPLSWPLCSSW